MSIRRLLKCQGIVIFIFAVIISIFLVKEVHTKPLSEKQIKKEIKKIKSQLKVINKKIKKSKKGTIPISGTEISSNPYIVENINLFSKEYYYIPNPQKLDLSFYLVSGRGKKTGRYYNFIHNGQRITCAEVKAIKIKMNKKDSKKKEELERQLNYFKGLLTEKIYFGYPENKRVLYLRKGEKLSLEIQETSYGREDLEWDVQDKDVVYIDKKGNVVAKGTGETYVYVSNANNSDSIIIKVVDPIKNFTAQALQYYESYSEDPFEMKLDVDGDWNNMVLRVEEIHDEVMNLLDDRDIKLYENEKGDVMLSISNFDYREDYILRVIDEASLRYVDILIKVIEERYLEENPIIEYKSDRYTYEAFRYDIDNSLDYFWEEKEERKFEKWYEEN